MKSFRNFCNPTCRFQVTGSIDVSRDWSRLHTLLLAKQSNRSFYVRSRGNNLSNINEFSWNAKYFNIVRKHTYLIVEAMPSHQPALLRDFSLWCLLLILLHNKFDSFISYVVEIFHSFPLNHSLHSLSHSVSMFSSCKYLSFKYL